MRHNLKMTKSRRQQEATTEHTQKKTEKKTNEE